jgi:hypothetical protein
MNVKLKFVFVKSMLLLMLVIPSFGVAASCGVSKGNVVPPPSEGGTSFFQRTFDNEGDKATVKEVFGGNVADKVREHCKVDLCDGTAKCKNKGGICKIANVTKINGKGNWSWVSCKRISGKKYSCTVTIENIECSCECQCPQAKDGGDGIGDTCGYSPTWQPPSQDCKDARADAKDWIAYIQSCKNPPPKGPWICEEMSHKEASLCKNSCQNVRKEICRHGTYPDPALADSIYEDCDSCMNSL